MLIVVHIKIMFEIVREKVNGKSWNVLDIYKALERVIYGLSSLKNLFIWGIIWSSCHALKLKGKRILRYLYWRLYSHRLSYWIAVPWKKTLEFHIDTYCFYLKAKETVWEKVRRGEKIERKQRT